MLTLCLGLGWCPSFYICLLQHRESWQCHTDANAWVLGPHDWGVPILPSGLFYVFICQTWASTGRKRQSWQAVGAQDTAQSRME